jgi:hypothetical protein
VYHNVLHSVSDSSKEFGLHTFPKSVLHQLVAAPGIQWLFPFALPLHPPHRGQHLTHHRLVLQCQRT